MKIIENNRTRPSRLPIGFFLVLLGAISLTTAGCPAGGGGGKFTASEKKAMITKSAPPKEAMEAMSKANMGAPTGKETSPWSKPTK